ncbi:hypothetical protein HO133_010978 [Letharia lupina]|uniref:General alpha-glucoside permease n=1 Tax=Letharia lupina TaxID=560253 RepID=A0A8H6CJR9_9LECA|nr:uncharacterized protein HO133_010978 [Letharia lupina]KAF6224401.1 hypothetical protein HO133_010978 [Letharia lupina]
MTELSYDLDESYVDRHEDDHIREQMATTEALLLEDTGSEVSRTLPYLLVLTCGGAGLQVIWSVVRSNGAPYLVSLGLSKSFTALVWLAAPLCGVVFQPIVGILSDRTRSRWGRRKPFIVGGTAGVIIATLALAFLTTPLSGDTQGQPPRMLIILLAITLIYAMNVSIQPIQAGLRTLIIENCPTHQQTQAAAWTSVLMGIGWFPFLFYSTTYVGEIYANHAIAIRQSLVAIETIDATSMMSADLTAMSKETSIAEDAIRYGTFANFLFSIVAFATNSLLPILLGVSIKPGLAARKPTAKFGISQAWTCAHIFFALAMFATMMVTSQAAATFLVASVGLSWALTHWAPFAIIGSELAARQSFNTRTNGFPDDEMSTMGVEVQAGAIMGLHNVAISAPQIIAALACSAIFGLAKSLGSQDGTGWVLRAGGCAALCAAYLTSSFDD